ncbi:LysR family transcriptional regulator [Roseovarius sp. 2305UL8-3]|uniref:LysR family transcriptional regulator n=1 Tax=Roseovarius conchicola TaxID=3121636 RepID=UPI003527AD9F
MNIKALRLFVSIMENATLSRAASDQNISQPAASRMVRILEEQVGETLFFRSRKRLLPTPEAEILLLEATRILSSIDNIPKVIAQNRTETIIPLRILSLPRIVNSLVIPALAAFDSHDRSQKYKIEVCPRREFGRRLLHGNYDVGVSTFPIPVEVPSTRFLAEAELKIMLMRGHSLAGRACLTPEDLNAERYIALDRHTVVRLAVDKALSLNEANLEVAHEVSNSDVAQSMVRDGLGFTFVDPAAIASEFRDQISLVPCSLAPRIKLAYFLPEQQVVHPARDVFLDQLVRASEAQYGGAP